MDVLRKEGLLEAVEPKPEGPGRADLIGANQDKALGLIRLHLEDSKLSEVQELETALQVWVCLANTHKKGAEAQRFQLRSEWTRLKQNSGEHIAAYVQRLRTTAANLRASGQSVDVTDKLMTLLNGLTDSYRTIVSVYQQLSQQRMSSLR
jgi:thymidylate synthase